VTIGEIIMKLDDITKPPFDPAVRLKEAKMLTVLFTPYDWHRIEIEFGRHISATEIHDLVMAIFTGKYKVVER
jgi:hypothetical protein